MIFYILYFNVLQNNFNTQYRLYLSKFLNENRIEKNFIIDFSQK